MDSATHPLLAPLSSEQQRVVDLVAETFLSSDYEWPFFDYVEGVLDQEDLDAIAILQSFPTIGGWNYGAVAWNQNDYAQGDVALTIVGMWHSKALRDHVPIFFNLVDYVVVRRKMERPQPRAVRQLAVTSDEFRQHWLRQRRRPLPARLTGQLKQHEPPLRYGSGSLDEDGSWSINDIGRQILPFAGLETIEDYVTRLEALIAPPTRIQPVLESPLSLAASLDYLDAVWQLTHDKKHLFTFRSAERTTRLAFPVQTADEFAAHLSALADILREANRALPDLPRGGKSRDHPLAKIQADLVGRLDATAVARVSDAIQALEMVVALRDASQHGGAHERAVRAFKELQVPYPPTNWGSAWQTISTQATNALNAVREELSVLT